jgi:hypothetical protein
LLDDHADATDIEGDRSWPLLAGLSLAGARIVSVPLALATQRREPGDARHQLSDALAVVQRFEQQLERPSSSLARLAAGLASQPPAQPPPGMLRRLSGKLSRR